MKCPARTSSRLSLIKQLISGKLGWARTFQREADILNICCNVFVLHCLSELLATMFYLNVRDSNDGVQAYMAQLTLVYVCCISQGIIMVSFKRYWWAWCCFVANLLRSNDPAKIRSDRLPPNWWFTTNPIPTVTFHGPWENIRPLGNESANTAQMVWCMQLCCQRLTLAAFGCQSIMYACSQHRILDTGR